MTRPRANQPDPPSAERSAATLTPAIALLLAALGLAALLGLPLAIRNVPAWGLLLLPLALTTPTQWAAIHEAIHGGLASGRASRLLGRALAIIHGAPFDLLRVGHLIHHRIYAADSAPPPVPDFPAPLRSLFFYARILGGVYLAEVASGLLMLLPRSLLNQLLRRAAAAPVLAGLEVEDWVQRQLLAPRALAEIRADVLAILALYTSAFMLYGPNGWMLLVLIATRAVLISFMDNLYHHRPEGAPRGSDNLSLPPWAAAAILNANFHGVHHRRPGLPWYALPAALTPAEAASRRPFFVVARNQLLAGVLGP